MNRWKLIVILLTAASVFLIVGATWFGWEPWNSFSAMANRWRPEPAFVHRVGLDLSTSLRAITALFTISLTGILLIFAIPSPIHRMEQALLTPPRQLLRIGLIGLTSALLVGAVSISSALTMSTFPLTIILSFLLFIAGFVGFVAMALALGRELLQRSDWSSLSPIYALLLGMLILFALSEVPLIGIILKILFFSLGLGVVIVTRFGSGKAWSLNALMED